MTIETVLTDEEIGRVAVANGCDPDLDDGALVMRLCRAIEQAVLQSQPMPPGISRPSWAGVTVWVGDRQKTHAITKQEFEHCKIDVLQAAFDHARRIEENNDASS